jgi:hypothetical protein
MADADGSGVGVARQIPDVAMREGEREGGKGICGREVRIYFIATYLSSDGDGGGGDVEEPDDEDSGDGGDEEEWRKPFWKVLL